MRNHLYNAEAINDLWRTYLQPKLGDRAYRFFASKTSNPADSFLSALIRASIFDERRGTYIPVSDIARAKGRNHLSAAAIADLPLVDGADTLNSMCLFANELKVEPNFASEDAVKPKDRVSFGSIQVFTMEFDVADVSYLKEQVSWIMPKKNPLDCPIGEFYKACSQYADFVGISVVYSGSKSLHIHVVFSTAQAEAAFSISGRSSAELRTGLASHWERLCAELLLHINTEGYLPDAKLRFPEQYRRLPGGIRTIDKEGHLLGFPIGTKLPQVVLWEKCRKRASGSELPLFFSPDAFCEPERKADRAHKRQRPSRVGPMTDKQTAYCRERLKEQFNDYPRFSDLKFEHGRYVARFHNSPNDRYPSSVMREDYSTISFHGRDAEGLVSPCLPMPLADMLRLWCQQIDESGQPRSEDEAAAHTRLRAIEASFSEKVIDKDTARAEIRSALLQTVCQEALLMVVGPEGIGKTTVLFKEFHRIARVLAAKGESQLAMFAFADYAAAEEKCRKFNELQECNGFHGVVLRSFTRSYDEVCEELGERPLTRLEAALMGLDLWDAIEASQPKVILALKRRHAIMWESLRNKRAVFFSVHGVMHGWSRDCSTRRMWAPSFWLYRERGEADATRELQKETTLGLAVHDEVKSEAVVTMWREEVGQWAERLVQSDYAAWTKGTTACRHESYERFVKEEGVPQFDGVKVTFEIADEIVTTNRSGWETVTTRDSGEYRRHWVPEKDEEDGPVDIYETCHGRIWRVSERSWWTDLAHQTILLTTEAVPAELVRATSSSWAILELEAPLMPKMEIVVHAQRSVTSANLEKVCRAFRELHPDTYIISNKAKVIVDTVPHVTARGSNALIGKHVMQTMTFVPPKRYEELQVLNAWTGRSDLIGLAHIDEYNQSAGRNMGFRWCGDVRHTLLINRTLCRLLTKSSAIGSCRYRWQLVLDKHQRSDATRQ